VSWKSKITTFQNDEIIHEQIQQSNKRKRDQSQQNLLESSMKSMSQLSISQEATASKKMKKSTNETMSSNNDNNNQSNQNNIILYKPSKYLKMPRKLLLHSLRLQLKCSLKKKKEQKFILSRLTTIDQQFCLDQICYLYQTFFDQGLQHQTWPVTVIVVLSTYTIIFLFWYFKDDILKIIQSNEPAIIQKYLEDYLILLRSKIDQSRIELMTQSSFCPTTMLSSLEILDQRLKEFVRLHHLDLLRKINYQVNKLNNNIQIKNLSKQLSSFRLTMKQVLIRIKILSIFICLLCSCIV
jgi:hypothetical protein